MKKILKILFMTVKIVFIVFCLFVGSLFFREQRLPAVLSEYILDQLSPEGVVAYADSVSFGFRHGLYICDLRVYDKTGVAQLKPVVSADSISVFFVSRRIEADGLVYTRLPDSYYEPGNQERDEPIEFQFPEIGSFEIVLRHPSVLDLAPEVVRGEVVIEPKRLMFNDIRLKWRESSEELSVNASCTMDLVEQRLFGRAEGHTKQNVMRPFLAALDIPVILEYLDAFTKVEGRIPASCSWEVNLVNKDTSIDLRLPSVRGCYNEVPFRRASGRMLLNIMTRGDFLNYHHEIGPIEMVDYYGNESKETITINGFNGTNTVVVTAKSGCRIQDILRIAGYAGDSVDEKVIGESSGRLTFVFPRAMTNNYEVLCGSGEVSIKNGQVMRFSGFKGLVSLLADKVPGVSWFTDSTQASCSYTIENGVFRSDDIYIEGPVFSIKMYGQYDITKDDLDFIARVQFVKNDSLVGKVVHSITWPFTKLLLEFRLRGSLDEPDWDYLSVLDRVLEVAR